MVLGWLSPQGQKGVVMEKLNVNEIEVNGIEYVRKGTQEAVAEKVDGLVYCIVRTYSAGVFAGYVKSRNGQDAVMIDSRGIWYWDGACGLSQLAVDGTVAPANCKFTVSVSKRELTQVIEIIPCTEKAKKSILSVSIWKK
jgi:hypothetical protein